MLDVEPTATRRLLASWLAALVLLGASQSPGRAAEPEYASTDGSETVRDEADESDESEQDVDPEVYVARGKREFGDVELHTGPSLLAIVPYVTAGGTLSLGRYVAVMSRLELLPIARAHFVVSSQVRFQFPTGSFSNGNIYTNLGVGIPLFPFKSNPKPISKVDLGGQHVFQSGLTMSGEIGLGHAPLENQVYPHVEVRYLFGYQF